MKRKEFIRNTVLATVGATGVLACNNSQQEEVNAPNVISNKKYSWKMVTTWPPNFPVLGEAANLFAQWMNEVTGGRVEIKVYGGGELVPALESFGAVSSGIIEFGCGAPYYWAGKAPASQFFCAVPFGMNAQQITAWMIGGEGEGYKLWKELYGAFNLVPFLGGNTGVQMGGWFNKEINSLDDLTDLKMRIPGLAGKVLKKAGGTAVLVPGSEIYIGLERGVIDATEWIGPYHDYKMGFYKVAKYYYTPGWHEPGAQLEFFMNKKKHDSLPKDIQAAIMSVSLRVQSWVLAEFDAQNGIYLEKLIKEEGVQLRKFPTEVLSQLRSHTKDALSDLAASDPMSKKVYESYEGFMKRLGKWSELTEKAYYNDVQVLKDSFLK